MRMPADHVPAVVAEYFDTVLIPAAQARSGLLAFATGFASAAAQRQAADMVRQYAPTAKAAGWMDEAGAIDIDTLYADATAGMSKGRPTIMGYTLDQSDLDKLRDIMNRHGG